MDRRLRLRSAKKNAKVFYIPKHCRSGHTREGWEEGIISSIDGDRVFVKYINPDRTYSTAKLTPVEDLVLDAPWIRTYPIRELPLRTIDLEVGHCYVTINVNEGYLFRASHNLNSCPYVTHNPYAIPFDKGCFNNGNFEQFRPATIEETLWLNKCIQEYKYLPPSEKVLEESDLFKPF